MFHEREFARIVTAWKPAKTVCETKIQTDAVARAHGLPNTLLPADWTALLTEFKSMHSKHLPDDKLLAQSCHENCAERLAEGTLKAEPLSTLVSVFEEEQQDARKPDTGKQFHLQLDSRSTIATKHRHVSTKPSHEKRLRAKSRHYDKFLARGPNEATRKGNLQGPRPQHVCGLPGEASRPGQLQLLQGG